jgi:hypothetical protein
MSKGANDRLDWREVEWNLLRAKLPGGEYVIARDEDGWSWRADFGFPNVTVSWCDGPEEGKAKAEQHWQARRGPRKPRPSLLSLLSIRRA